MKPLLFITILILFTSCEDPEITYDYPDGISKPDKVIQSFGCGNIFVYQFLDSLKALTVRIDGNKCNLTKRLQTIDLSQSNPNLSVVLEIAGNYPDSIYFNYCNDVAFPNMGITRKYKAISGKLTFSVSEDNPIKEPVWKSLYSVTIKIENLHLYNRENNAEIILGEVVFWDVRVGWLPG